MAPTIEQVRWLIEVVVDLWSWWGEGSRQEKIWKANRAAYAIKANCPNDPEQFARRVKIALEAA